MAGFEIEGALPAEHQQIEVECEERFLEVFWYGGSAFDAWLNICSSKVTFRDARNGTLNCFTGSSGAPHPACCICTNRAGLWNCISAASRLAGLVELLHDEHALSATPKQCHENKSLLLPKPHNSGLVFNMGVLFTSAAIQIIACGNIVFFIDSHIDKRTWTFIFGSCFSLSILIPSAHNYRVFSFLGVIMLSYTAWYMTTAALVHGKGPSVRHTGPHNYVGYYAAVSTLVAFGGHSVPVEIMDAMWKPRKFKKVYLYSILYIFFITIPSSVSVYWVFGDALFTSANAFGVLPRSIFRNTAVILMLFHQFYQFGILSLPIYLAWEKLFGIHESGKYVTKTLARLPVFLALWLTALMFPFFGPINSFAGSFFLSLGTYVIPCAATMVTYWSSASRSSAVEQPPFHMNWITLFCINFGVIIWMSVVATGLGAWASIVNLQKQAHGFGLFAQCYQCPKRD